jgi:hypothetical protein
MRRVDDMGQPRPSTNQPVPVSTNGAGFTVVGPWPQFMVISASTRVVMSATAGFALRIASWTLRASAGSGAAIQASASALSSNSRFMASNPTTESRCVARFVGRGASGRSRGDGILTSSVSR